MAWNSMPQDDTAAQRGLRIAEKDLARKPTLFEESISSDEVKAARRQVQPLIDRIRNALKAE
ncbi:MAG TPA: hypothetical protein PK847_13795 [Candidatus Sumerlaeota bacterium]|nr:hypothetical protein [Candidatus Sumerlaeota bacterium]